MPKNKSVSSRLHVSLLSAALLIAVPLQANAEGFFSKIFGGSKGGAGFETLLSHVPADTPYLFANKNSIPEEVMEFHMKRGKDMLSMFANSQTMVKKDENKEEKKDDSKKEDASAFFEALMKDYSELMANDKFEETGLSLQANSMIYGFDLMPVIRMSIADKEKVMAMIKRAEEKSGYKVELSKCGELDCFTTTNPKDDMSIAVVFGESQLSAGLFKPENKDKTIDHLIGKSKPSESYSEKSWDNFLKTNAYKGFGDGFINLKTIYNKAKPMIAADMKKKVDEKQIEGCMSVIEEHLDNIPEIVFGTKNLEEKSMDYELLFKTSEGVSSVIQEIPNKTNIAKRAENAIFDFGINVNFSKLRDALTQYSNFLIKSGETHKCNAIKPQEIRKGMGGMAMVMNMGLSQFNSVYASVSDIEMDDKMQPKKVDAVISIGANDPAGLVAMLGMVNPAIMSFKIPADGKTVKVPENLLPPGKGKPIPDLYVNRTDKELNIMVGNDKPALVEYKNDKPQMSFSSMDGKRYMEKFAAIMKNMPNLPKDEMDLDMIENMSGLSGKIHSATSADDRGLVINYRLEY